MSTIIQPTRRGFLLGLLAAPVIVKASSLMAVKPIHDAPTHALIRTFNYEPVGGYTEIFDGTGWRLIKAWARVYGDPSQTPVVIDWTKHVDLISARLSA